jgi:hypothetical protein
VSTFSNAGRQGDPWSSDWKVVAATAGFVFSAILLLGAALLGMARVAWLEPIFGHDKAVAIELTIALPVAWYASAVVASGMQLSPGWRAAAIMAVTTFLLMAAAYAVLVAPSSMGIDSLTHGSLGLDMVIQALVSALPFASRRVLRKPSTTSQAGRVRI